jgi:DNA polymerase III alpha subunit
VGNVTFPCGCSFERLDGGEDINVDFGDKLPLIKFDVYTNTNLHCSATWNMLMEGKTVGVFQLESQHGQSWAKKIKPDSLEVYGALNALLRPGCVRALSGNPPKSMTHRYQDRRHKKEEVEFFGVKELEPILKPTYGVLVYQEQATQIAVALAGFNPQEADILRKAIGKKKAEIMAEVETTFMEGVKKHGVITEEKGREIFSWIRESQRYSFNKSHAITYGMNSYWSAYCKQHFPVQFFCSWMRGASWKPDRYEEINTLVLEAKTMAVEINTPDFRHKEALCYVKDNEVYFGLLDVRGVGDAAINNILLQIREVELLLDKKLRDWIWLDYLIYLSQRVKVDQTKAIIQSGALDFFGIPRNQLLFEVRKWRTLTEKEQLWIYQHQYGQFNGDEGRTEAKWNSLADCLNDCAKPKKEGGGCNNVNRVEIVKSCAKQLVNPPEELKDTPASIVWAEEKYLGTPITTSAIQACEEAFVANSTCQEAERAFLDYTVLAVEVLRVKEIRTKQGKNPGQKMAFLSVRDDSGMSDNIVCFPNSWLLYKDILYEKNTVLMQISKTDKGSFSIEKAKQI